jgi:hypothetical protein
MGEPKDDFIIFDYFALKDSTGYIMQKLGEDFTI